MVPEALELVPALAQVLVAQALQARVAPALQVRVALEVLVVQEGPEQAPVECQAWVAWAAWGAWEAWAECPV